MEQRFDIGGGPPQVAVVGTASAIIVPPRRRKKIILVNISDTRIDVSRSGTAILGAGIALYPNGGVFVDEPDTWGRIYQGPYAAISSGAAKALAISEDF